VSEYHVVVDALMIIAFGLGMGLARRAVDLYANW
jgi:hypothetical protein